MIRGIGIDGVASEMGALSRHYHDYKVDRKDLVDSLMRRYTASEEEAEAAVRKALRAGVVCEVGTAIELVEEPW